MSTSARLTAPRLETELDGRPAVVLLGEVTTVGRQAENTLPVRKHELSRVHFRITRSHGGYQLENLSDAGTRVNGLWVLFASLREGDVIEAGRLELSVHLGQEATWDAPRPYYPMRRGVPLFRTEDTAQALAERATDGALTDGDRVGLELARRLYAEDRPRTGAEEQELAGLRAAHARLMACEDAARALFGVRRARELFPAVAEQLLGVLAGDVAAVLSSGQKLERLALVRGEAAGQRLDCWRQAVELAEQKSGWVTASRPVPQERFDGVPRHETLLAFSAALGADRLLIFYCEAHRRPRGFDRDDADSMKRLAYAAMATLERLEAARRPRR